MPKKPQFGFLRTGAVMGFLPDNPRNHTTAFISELAGTFMFLFFAFAIAQVANTPPPDGSQTTPNILTILFIALGFGCSVAVNVWLFYRVSGGMFNPAVSNDHDNDNARSADVLLGHIDSLSSRCSAGHTGLRGLRSPDVRRNRGGSGGLCYPPWSYGCERSTRRRVLNHPRSLHRNVRHNAAGMGGCHAGCGKA